MLTNNKAKSIWTEDLLVKSPVSYPILPNCSYLIGTVPILTQEKGRKKERFYHVFLFLQKSACSNV